MKYLEIDISKKYRTIFVSKFINHSSPMSQVCSDMQKRNILPRNIQIRHASMTSFENDTFRADL